jgi:hypothetical protein
VLAEPAVTEPALRQAVAARGELPDELAPFVSKVHDRAYEIVDADVEALREAGYDENEIFELTVAAAVGAGLHRLETGLAALEGRR